MIYKVKSFSLFTDFDIHLFREGKHFQLYKKFGSHYMEVDGVKGTYFSVWAPTAKNVSVIGDFNFWVKGKHTLQVRWDESGIWEGFIPGVNPGSVYKYAIQSHNNDIELEKSDPYARSCEHPPRTASIVWAADYVWGDDKWMVDRKESNQLNRPFSVYELHLSSWKKKNGNVNLTYRELAYDLVDYVKNLGFTHVEFMPIMEYPYDPSWGYQLVGYFAPTSRFGNPEEFKILVDSFHRAGIGVILDWVPSHFPSDDHGLGFFDGSHLYEHPDPRKGYHQDWKSLIFNYERPEVRSFLISNAFFWLDQFHVDGLRVDAVASMLYLDYSRKDGEWEPNEFGGRENLATISFLKDLNSAVYSEFSGIQTIAEESTSFPKVTGSIEEGGLGFGMKWMMGWMHDTLEYFKKETIYRSYHQNDITFSATYAFTENFMLPFSHDEVVYGKKSILGRMQGDRWQQFANLRLLYSYMFTHPGAKLLFMGSEFGQQEEWNFENSLDWHLLKESQHVQVQETIKALNGLYRREKALYELQFSPSGFEWISYDDYQNSILVYLRKSKESDSQLLIVCNFTPNTHLSYDVGLPESSKLNLIYNSDETQFGGSGFDLDDEIKVEKDFMHGRQHKASLKIGPLSTAVYRVLK